ncbi:hypothetical protein BKE38_10470 [Pseudoroseomonas deserti]|uniref:DUF2065 domain-containing protein n=2 Tax=Teichococcus deserti TaxID=1817963 RepID=A0A1V2H397_9PROT|nr:hypothetical protein BKE38_10470 [Pseudoroseomonas deserti]
MQLIAGAFAFLALEGLLYAAFPEAMRRMLATTLALPPERLRLVGLAVAAVGIGLATLLTR